MLLAFALAAKALLMIVKLGSEIAEGGTTAFDVAVLTQLRHATRAMYSGKRRSGG